MKKVYHSLKALATLLGVVSLINFLGINSLPSLWGSFGNAPTIILFGASAISLLLVWYRLPNRRYKMPYVIVAVVLAFILYIRLNTVTDRELDVTYQGLYLLVFNRSHVYFMFYGLWAWFDYALMILTIMLCISRVILKHHPKFR
jgi:MFS superfamily sulfate permease-like transporter